MTIGKPKLAQEDSDFAINIHNLKINLSLVSYIYRVNLSCENTLERYLLVVL